MLWIVIPIHSIYWLLIISWHHLKKIWIIANIMRFYTTGFSLFSSLQLPVFYGIRTNNVLNKNCLTTDKNCHCDKNSSWKASQLINYYNCLMIIVSPSQRAFPVIACLITSFFWDPATCQACPSLDIQERKTLDFICSEYTVFFYWSQIVTTWQSQIWGFPM